MLKALKYRDFMVFYNAYMEDVRQEKAKELPPYIFQHCKMVSHFEKEYHEYKKMNKFAGDYGDGIKTKFDMEVRERIRNNVEEKDEIYE
ncbi:hypothetical protein Phum_PHUM278130 [Pediculus humanus corporis]|uniref:Uncharacterized protein n=1 Tax=Pediculus humanus subsp. corporis TaxID=121224 RepID=E0VL07_PEDHC|nr:uncharacterized protein Phum_PHUM278130 [Pediculus humanus corporis]EEB14063.1 hypothetical protein Phum_PHUM278130 [Pediculus humanus corporis]